MDEKNVTINKIHDAARMVLRKKLLEFITETHYSLVDVSKAAGISYNALHNLVNATRKTRPDVLRSLEDYLITYAEKKAKQQKGVKSGAQ